jgi:protein HIRA/HIR1
MADSTATNGAAPEVAPTPAPPPKDPQAEKVDKLKQRVTITKDGKKRIAPLLVSSSNQGETNLPRPQLQAAVRNGGAGSDEPAGKILDLSKPYDGLPKGGLASLLLGNKRKYAEVDGADGEEERRRHEKRIQTVQQTGATPIVQNTPDGLVPAGTSAAEKDKKTEVPDVLRPAVVNPSLSVSQVRLAVPMVRSVILRPLDPTRNPDAEPISEAQQDLTDPSTSNGAQLNNNNIIFEARNATGPTRTGRAADREPTRITVSRRSQILWQDFLPRAALLVTGNRNFWAAGCEDGSMYLWTPAGRRLACAIVLEAQPVILDCRGWWLMVLTAAGLAYVWDVRTMKAAHPPVSLAPVLDSASASLGVGAGAHLTHAPSLMFARLNSQGRVVVGMSNGDGFTYNPDMFVWQRLSESWWAVGSQYWNTGDTSSSAPTTTTATRKQDGPSSYLDDISPENISAGIIPLLERNTTSQSLLKGRAFFLQRLVKALLSAEGYEGFESSVSIAHLENRVAAAYTLGARDEFRVYLIMYAKRLGAEGLRNKVEELLKGLTGRLFEEEDEADGDGDVGGRDGGLEWGDTSEIFGWKREVLLREVVMVLGRQRDLQRVVVPYARALGVVDGGGGEGMITDG